MSCLKKSCLFLLSLGLLVSLALPAEAKKIRPAKTASATPAAAKPLEFVPGSWTIVLLPDVQHYSRAYPGLFSLQTSWIVKNKQKYNIQYVLTLGDITDGNTPREWRRARDAMSNLDGKVPYVMCMGNHDTSGSPKNSTDRETPMNKYFPVSLFKDRPTFGGVMKADRLENAYYLFSAGGSDWIVVVLEWAPRNEVVAWANSVLDKYPQRKAILVTHAYMYSDNTRYDYAKNGTRQTWNPHSYGPAGTVNDGQELWDKLVKKHNFVFTFNGHVLNSGTGFLTSKNEQGKKVQQMLVNYQCRNLGGEGYLRLVRILPDGKTVQAVSYSPLYDTYLTEPNQQFVFTLD